jgi:hypothetical protein
MLLLILVSWTILGFISANIAKKRGRNPIFWFFMVILIGAFAPLLVSVLGSKAKRSSLEPPIVERKAIPSFPPSLCQKLWYYLDQEDKHQGPMSFPALKGLFEEGKIHLNTYIWNEEMENWKEIQEIPLCKESLEK